MTEAFWCDFCFWTYILIVLIALYGIGLFVWWWLKVGHASEVYKYFIVLLFSEAFYNFFNALARYFRFNDEDTTDYLMLMDHPIWKLRAAFHLIVLSLIIGRMTVRAVRTIRKARRFKTQDDNGGDNVQGTDR